jgi:hypothetical protein
MIDQDSAGWTGIWRVAAIAAVVQLLCTLITIAVVFTLGVEPATAEEAFTLLHEDRVTALLRFDFPSLFNVALFAVTAVALFGALRRVHFALSTLAMALTLVGVAIAMATHGAMSMIHLADRFAAAGSTAEREMLLAAGEAAIATGWWHSSGGFMAGLFLQGGTFLMHAVMWRSSRFLKATAITGMLANGLDLLHVLVGVVSPKIAELLSIALAIYVIWYPLLAFDLFRLARREEG